MELRADLLKNLVMKLPQYRFRQLANGMRTHGNYVVKYFPFIYQSSFSEPLECMHATPDDGCRFGGHSLQPFEERSRPPAVLFKVTLNDGWQWDRLTTT